MTGAAGFIGSHLCRELWDNGHDVRGLDNHVTDAVPYNQPLEKLLPWWHGAATYLDDALEIEKRLDAERAIGWEPDVVIHLAAKVGRLFGEDDVYRTAQDNAGMTAHVAKVCGDRGIRLMYASTSEVYGDRGDHLCLEDEPFVGVPHNIYGLSKRWGEEACQLYAPDGLVLLRLSMPYGPGLPAGRGRAALINFLYSALHLEPITVHRGSERSWCWIGDTVRGVRMLLQGMHTGAFNIGRDDNALTMREVAEMACDLTGAPYDLIREVDAPARQTVVKRLSTTKIRSLGWRPEVDLPEGMERTLAYVADRYPIVAAA